MNAAQRRKAKRDAWRHAERCQRCDGLGFDRWNYGDDEDDYDPPCMVCDGLAYLPKGGRVYLAKDGRVSVRLPGVGSI